MMPRKKEFKRNRNIRLLSPRLGSQTSAAPWPSHCSLVPYKVTASRCFTPPGTLRDQGRSRATLSLPNLLGPTRSAVAHSAQADSGSVPGHIPVRLGPTRIPASIHVT